MTPMNATESSKAAPHNWRATVALLVFSAAFGGLLMFGLAASDETQLTASCGGGSCDGGCRASTSPESVSTAPTSCSEIHSSLRGGARRTVALGTR